MALGMFFLTVYSFYALNNRISPVAGVSFWLGSANILLALFNLIPGFPLDGGRILRAFLWDHWDDMARATRVVSQFGNAFASHHSRHPTISGNAKHHFGPVAPIHRALRSSLPLGVTRVSC
jgi:hypothetical protein